MIFRDPQINPDFGLEAAFETKQVVYDAARQENEAFLAAMASNPTKWLSSWEEMKRLRREKQSAILHSMSSENPLRELDQKPVEVEHVRSIVKQIDQLEKTLRENSSAYRQQARLEQVTLDDAKSALRQGQALVEYIKFHPYDFEKQRFQQPHYGAFVLNESSKLVKASTLGDAREIETLVEGLRGRRSSLDDFIAGSDKSQKDAEIGISEKSIAEASRRLSDRIWQPIESGLPEGGRVYIGTEGAISLVPFEIFSRQDKLGILKYLFVDREIVYVGSGRDLARLALARMTQSQVKKQLHWWETQRLMSIRKQLLRLLLNRM